MGSLLAEGLVRRGEEGGGLALDAGQTVPGQPVAQLQLHEEVQRQGKYRGQHDEDDPGDLDGGAAGLVDQHQHHCQTQQQGAAVDQVFPQPDKSPEEEAGLDGQQGQHQGGAAKNQTAQPPLALVEQQHGVVFLFLPLAFPVLFRHRGILPSGFCHHTTVGKVL